MNFFERFRKPRKSNEEIEQEYKASQEKLVRAAEEYNRTLAGGNEELEKARNDRADAQESLNRTLKELENLNTDKE